MSKSLRQQTGLKNGFFTKLKAKNDYIKVPTTSGISSTTLQVTLWVSFVPIKAKEEKKKKKKKKKKMMMMMMMKQMKKKHSMTQF